MIKTNLKEKKVAKSNLKVVDNREIKTTAYSDINLKEYTDNIYNEFVKKTPIRDEEGEMDKKIKKLMYLNIHWFGATLVDRTDRMSVESSLIVRVPMNYYNIFGIFLGK